MKNVIITGVNGQLGRALKKRLIKEKYNVIGIDLILKKNNINNNHYKCDISSEKDVSILFNKFKKRNVKLDLLINNAGIGVYGHLKNRKEIEIDQVMKTNLQGTINMTKYFYIYTKKKAYLKKIINIGSIYGIIAPDFGIYQGDDRRFSSEIYGATKAGVCQLSKYFARSFSGENYIVNTVSPGGIINKKLQSKNFINKYIKNVPIKRMASLKDIIDPIIFMCSDESNYINGHNLIIDGGLSC